MADLLKDLYSFNHSPLGFLMPYNKDQFSRLVSSNPMRNVNTTASMPIQVLANTNIPNKSVSSPMGLPFKPIVKQDNSNINKPVVPQNLQPTTGVNENQIKALFSSPSFIQQLIALITNAMR